jgi:hypothetical protein
MISASGGGHWLEMTQRRGRGRGHTQLMVPAGSLMLISRLEAQQWLRFPYVYIHFIWLAWHAHTARRNRRQCSATATACGITRYGLGYPRRLAMASMAPAPSRRRGRGRR